MKPLAPITPGDRFGKLTVIAQAQSRASATGSKCDGRRALVRCDCGVEKDMRVTSLRTGAAKSCGCGRKGHHTAKVAAPVTVGPKPIIPLGRPSDRTLIGRLHLLAHPDWRGVVRWRGQPISVPELARLLDTDPEDLDLRGGILARWLEAVIVGGHSLIVYGRHVTTNEEFEAARQRLLSRAGGEVIALPRQAEAA